MKKEDHPHSKQSDAVQKLKERVQKGITEVEARLHRMILYGNYSYSDLQERLGTLKPDKNFHRKRRMPPYHSRAWRQFEGMKLTIFYNPIGFAKKSRIEFNFLSVNSLMKLHTALPGLKVHSAEYTLDIFCENPSRVADLFHFLLRHMYFKYRTEKVKYFGGRFTGDSGDYDREENAGVHMGENAKVYERGPDSKRQKEKDEDGYTRVFWPHWEVDRVRVEFTFDRRHRGRGGLDELADLIRNPNFKKKIHHLFQFKIFKGSNALPKAMEKYWYRNKKGEKVWIEILQEVYRKAYELRKNPRQYLKDAKGLKDLKGKVELAVDAFEKDWAKQRKDFLKENPEVVL